MAGWTQCHIIAEAKNTNCELCLRSGRDSLWPFSLEMKGGEHTGGWREHVWLKLLALWNDPELISKEKRTSQQRHFQSIAKQPRKHSFEWSYFPMMAVWKDIGFKETDLEHDYVSPDQRKLTGSNWQSWGTEKRRHFQKPCHWVKARLSNVAVISPSLSSASGVLMLSHPVCFQRKPLEHHACDFTIS